jgi:hypothetical protein
MTNNNEILKNANFDDPKLCSICFDPYTTANPVMSYIGCLNHFICNNCVTRYGSNKCQTCGTPGGNYTKNDSLTQTVVGQSQSFKQAADKDVDFNVVNERGQTYALNMHTSK